MSITYLCDSPGPVGLLSSALALVGERHQWYFERFGVTGITAVFGAVFYFGF